MEGERVCPRLWGPTKKHGVPHASWRWSQGQRPVPPCGTPPRARRRPAAADGGGSCLSPSPRPDRCRRRPAAGVRPAGRTASRPARGWGDVRKRGGQPGTGRRWRGCHGKRGFIVPILTDSARGQSSAHGEVCVCFFIQRAGKRLKKHLSMLATL